MKATLELAMINFNCFKRRNLKFNFMCFKKLRNPKSHHLKNVEKSILSSYAEYRLYGIVQRAPFSDSIGPNFKGLRNPFVISYRLASFAKVHKYCQFIEISKSFVSN